MPWCPKCGYEYKDGITKCADCNVDLVESLDVREENENTLDVIEIIPDNDEIVDAVEYASDNEISDFEDEQVFAQMMENADLIESKKSFEAEVPFVKAIDKAENYKSSAYALLLVGVLGVIALVLSFVGVLNFAIDSHMKPIVYSALGLMFVIFIVIGIRSYIRSKQFLTMASKEDDLTFKINNYFSELSKEDIDKQAFMEDIEDDTEEAKFFKRNEAIKSLIKEQFGDLESSFVSEMAENVYVKLYES